MFARPSLALRTMPRVAPRATVVSRPLVSLNSLVTKPKHAPLALRSYSAPKETTEYNSFGSPRVKRDSRAPIVSPHLTIYKFPINAITSISHRITGLALTGGILLFCAPLISNPIGFTQAVVALKLAYPVLGPVIKLAITLPFVYHVVAGCRHLMWDYLSRGLDSIEQMDKSSYAVIFISLALSLFLSILL